MCLWRRWWLMKQNTCFSFFLSFLIRAAFLSKHVVLQRVYCNHTNWARERENAIQGDQTIFAVISKRNLLLFVFLLQLLWTFVFWVLEKQKEESTILLSMPCDMALLFGMCVCMCVQECDNSVENFICWNIELRIVNTSTIAANKTSTLTPQAPTTSK